MAFQASAQHSINIDATLNPSQKTISIKQEITFTNTSEDTLREIFLFDWANSFSSKTTPLGKRFAENYESAFHFEKDGDRGKTTIEYVHNTSAMPLQWQRGEAVDILKIIPEKPLHPGANYTFNLEYTVKVPNDRFTRYGVNNANDYKLRYWYIAPAVYDGEWHIYSNKNTDDLYLNLSEFSITLHTPTNYVVTSDLDVEMASATLDEKIIVLKGSQRSGAVLYLEKNPTFETIETDKLTVVTNLQNSKVNPPVQALMIDRIVHFFGQSPWLLSF